MIEVTTKPDGSGRNWLETGNFITDKFGDKVWQCDPKARYPHHDNALEVKREYDGRGKAQQIHWKIIIPDGYQKSIVKKWGDGDITPVWSPDD